MPDSLYEHCVFVNCPFDDEYRPLFYAIVFTLHDCGFAARSALAVTDASQVRIEKIVAMIASSKFGLHDISRTELDAGTGLPRFNMPLELGLFLGAKRFGTGKQRQKNCLIMDVERYRYQKFISDIAGQDIVAHGGDEARAIRAIRDWLSDVDPSMKIPGGATIAQRYGAFQAVLPAACAKIGLDPDALTFNDYVLQVEEWLKSNAWAPAS
jgi:hypothetical protein